MDIVLSYGNLFIARWQSDCTSLGLHDNTLLEKLGTRQPDGYEVFFCVPTGNYM